MREPLLRLRRSSRINRYIMECKSEKVSYVPVWFTELIDTLWNVNEEKITEITEIVQELIDTLWNVNFSRFLYSSFSQAN